MIQYEIKGQEGLFSTDPFCNIEFLKKCLKSVFNLAITWKRTQNDSGQLSTEIKVLDVLVVFSLYLH